MQNGYLKTAESYEIKQQTENKTKLSSLWVILLLKIFKFLSNSHALFLRFVYTSSALILICLAIIYIAVCEPKHIYGLRNKNVKK